MNVIPSISPLISRVFLLIAVAMTLSLKAQSEQPPIKIIEQKMAKQEVCWSHGDLECYMAAYWKSDSLKFIGSKGLTYGWNSTLANYKKAYPSKESMGKLTFQNLHIEILSNEYVSVIGKWYLSRKEGDLSGHYSLIWQKINNNWVIISDHSS